MELRHLRYVTAVAECGSFRGAARMLGVRESAVSRRVRDLEDEIGAALFIRHHAGVTLTFAGERFLGRITKALSLIGDAVRDVGVVGRGEEGVVRIGIRSSLASGYLAELFQAFDERHANVRLDIIEGGHAEHVAAVLQHRIDVAFLIGRRPAVGCEMEHLWDERVFVVMAVEHELADRDVIVWDDLRDQHLIVSEVQPGPEIYDYMVEHLAGPGYHPSIERHGVGRDNLMQLVALGRSVTLTSEATTGMHFPGVVFRILADETLPFCAVWSARNDNPAQRRLLSLARSMTKARTQNKAMNGRNRHSLDRDASEPS